MEGRKIKTIQWTINLPMDFPEHWDDDMIEFHLNDSSWCCSNLIDELEKYDEENGCICSICEAKVVDRLEKSMRDDTRKYLNQEAKYCDEIWKEHCFNKDNQLTHFHVCDFELMAMLNRFKKSYKKYEKEWDKKCKEYLASIGHSQDECMECCDYCPHMRYLTLSEDNYFLNIASLGIDRFIFDEEK